MSKETAAVQTTTAAPAWVQARQAMEVVSERFSTVNGSLPFGKELGFAVQLLKRNSYLLDIALKDKSELQAAIYNVALTGLSLNPVLKYAYLLPRGGKICLEPSYMGFIKILTDAGSVKQVWSDVIREYDNYSIERGTNPKIHHSFPLQENRGEIIAVYAVALLADGGTQFEVMQKSEVEAIKARSESVKAGKQTPWDSDESEMYKKTVIRRLFKYLPKTEIPEKTLNALEVFDNNHELEPIDNSVKGVNLSKEKARALSFLEAQTDAIALESQRPIFEKHGLTAELNNKLMELTNE